MEVLDFSDILSSIQYLYSVRGISCLVIFDQINTLASIFENAHTLLLKDDTEKLMSKDALK